jgi:hypothetical protein
VAIKDLLRRHPRWADECIVAVSGIEAGLHKLSSVVDPQLESAWFGDSTLAPEM